MNVKTGLARQQKRPDDLPPFDREAIERLMTSFWSGRSPHTLVAYKLDIEDFCAFLVRNHGLDPRTLQLEVLRIFLCGGAGRANELVLGYRVDLKARGKAPSTTNRRLAAVRSLVKLARMIGLTYWNVEVGGVRHEPSRDTRGPTPDVITRILALTNQQPSHLGLRNRAMLRLMFDLGLRVAEVVRLDVADVNLDAAGVWVLGKGRTRKERLTLPGPTIDALRAWLTHRGHQPGPLLLSFSNRPAAENQRLCTRGAYRIIRNLGAAVGIHLHPHALRHSAITQAVEAATRAGLSLDQVRDFSRHKNISTLLIYRDQLTNEQGRLAELVAKQVQRHAGRDPRSHRRAKAHGTP